MKPFIYIFIFIPLLSLAQETNFIVNENNLWSTVETYCIPEGNYYKSHYLKIEGDTIINDTLYQKVLKSEDQLMEIWETYALLREDETGKVFVRPPDYIEGLIYDFNVNIGDSVLVQNVYVSSFRYFVVTNIDSVEFITGSKKRITLYNEEYGQTEEWVESFGSYLGLINSGGFDTNTCGSYEAMCFEENGVLVYQNPYFSSCFIDSLVTEVEEIAFTSEFSIFPNPFKNELNIQLQNKNLLGQDFQIYNGVGQIVFQKKFLSETTSINFSDLSSGFYFVKLPNQIEKIIKTP